MCSCAEGPPGRCPQLLARPAQSPHQGRRCRHSQAGLQHSAGVSAEAGRGHAGQQGRSHRQGEENGDGRVDGHDLTELGERHNDAEEKRDGGDCCGDGAGHYGNAHMVHCLQSSPLPLG